MVRAAVSSDVRFAAPPFGGANILLMIPRVANLAPLGLDSYPGLLSGNPPSGVLVEEVISTGTGMII
jgi:hypothetical protein